MIGVVHLVWGPLGRDPLERFIASYRRHDAGADHELILVWNATPAPQREELTDALREVRYRSLPLSDPVPDLAAYRLAAERLPHDHLCFLNSHTEITAGGWLAKLKAALPRDRAPAIIGATGSWMSIRSAYAHLAGVPSGYGPAALPRRMTFDEMRRMNAELREEGGSAAPAPMRHRLELAGRRVLQSPGFPNPHIRTNGFLAERQLLSQLIGREPTSKLDTYGLEAGSQSLTAQILEQGGAARVVDAEGDDHAVDGWDRSGTFWQGDQDRLIFSDNQTRLYERGSRHRREILAGWAWGNSDRASDPGARGR